MVRLRLLLLCRINLNHVRSKKATNFTFYKLSFNFKSLNRYYQIINPSRYSMSHPELAPIVIPMGIAIPTAASPARIVFGVTTEVALLSGYNALLTGTRLCIEKLK
jgi:hypothetical protein